MTRTPIICVALLGLPLGIAAQEPAGEPDLFSLIFAPGPVTAWRLSPVPVEGGQTAATDETPDDGEVDGLYRAAEALERSIVEEEARNGPQSSVLIEYFRSLAELHQRIGNHLLAIAALEQASAIIRINDGLESLDQAEVMQQMIRSSEIVGAFTDADTLQEDLLLLAQKNESDPLVPSILAGVADRQIDAVKAYLDVSVWPRARSSIQATMGSGWEAGTDRSGRQRAFTELEVLGNRYDSAIERALEAEGADSGDAFDQEAELTDVYELIDTANDFLEVGVLPRYDRGVLTWEPERPMSDREFAATALHRARRLYSAAMQAAYRQGNRSEYLTLEEQFVETYYFQLANPELDSESYERNTLFPVQQRYQTPLESVLRARVADRLIRDSSVVEVARAQVEFPKPRKKRRRR